MARAPDRLAQPDGRAKAPALLTQAGAKLRQWRVNRPCRPLRPPPLLRRILGWTASGPRRAPASTVESKAAPAAALHAALIAALGIGLLAPALAQPVQDQLPSAVARALQRAKLPPQALAAMVLPADADGPSRRGQVPPRAGDPHWHYQGLLPLQPASTMKALTAAVALDLLGPNLQGSTELWTRAPITPSALIDQGVLEGDLIIRGGADPELGLQELWGLMAELRAQGIRTLGGDIVLDRHLFRPARMDIGVPPFDEQPEFPYNMIPDALQLSGNLMGIHISAEDGGIQARAVPPLPGVVIDTSELTLNRRRCRDWDVDWNSPPTVRRDAPGDAPGTLRVVLRGAFPQHCEVRYWLQLIDRDDLAERSLQYIWQSLGGTWRGRVRTETASALPPLAPWPAPLARLLPPNPDAVAARAARQGAAPDSDADDEDTPAAPLIDAGAPPRRLAVHRSQPWGEMLRTTNKRSDNVRARLLYLMLGAQTAAGDTTTTTTELSARAVRRWLSEREIPAPGLVLDNGSGLSRSTRIAPVTLAMALQAAYHGRWASELMSSLPLAGIDGTMRRRLRSSEAGGWARLKTGALRNAAALAGYVPDPQGRWWVVVGMVNHDQAGAGRPALDALVDWVASGGMSGGETADAR